MEYKYLATRGALDEATAIAERDVAASADVRDVLRKPIPTSILALVPESVAREHQAEPVAWDGYILTLAGACPLGIARPTLVPFSMLMFRRLSSGELTLAGRSGPAKPAWLRSAVLPLAFRWRANRTRPHVEAKRTDGRTGHWTV